MDTATIDLSDLAQDGDTLELADGRTLRVRVEPDQDHSVFDEEFWGEFEWVSRTNGYGYTERPDGFDGNAEILERDGASVLWWQPPRGDYALSYPRGTKEFAEFRRSVRDLLEYGFKGVILELLDGADAYGMPIVVEEQSLWGIDSVDGGYLKDVVSDLFAEMEGVR